jgi:hypothetical protein
MISLPSPTIRFTLYFKGKMKKNLLNMSPSELREMSKEDVHDGYRKILENMLMDFYVATTDSDVKIETLFDLNQFIRRWLDKRISPPNEAWKPGDCGK